MAITKYFYKDATLGVFVIGNDTVPTGNCVLKFDVNDTVVTVLSVDTQKVILEAIEITNLLKESDVAYTNKTDLLTGIKDFF